MSISSINGVSGTVSRYTYNATGGETSVSGTDANGATIAYMIGKEEVYVNGVLLVRTTDYTATDGATISLVNALVASDVLEIVTFSSYSIPTAISSTTVQSKGDLIVGVSPSVVTNLPVGADGSTLVANSLVGTGVSWAGPTITAGKNACINGGFDIWQRGTSSSSSGFQTADRWYQYIPSGSGTYSQETSVVPTGFTYASKFTSSAAGSAADWLQSVETLNAIQFAGKVVTISCYIAASASTSFSLDLEYSTSTDYSVSGGSWTGVSATTGGSATVSSTTYTRLTGTYTVPSTARTLRIGMFASGMASGTIAYITGYQLELGSTPTAFSRAGGTLQGELSACQRYYWRNTPAVAYGIHATLTYNNSTTTEVAQIKLPVVMRTAPSGTIDYANLRVQQPGVGSVGTISGMAYAGETNANNVLLQVTITGSTYSSTAPYQLLNDNNTAGYLGFSAEL